MPEAGDFGKIVQLIIPFVAIAVFIAVQISLMKEVLKKKEREEW